MSRTQPTDDDFIIIPPSQPFNKNGQPSAPQRATPSKIVTQPKTSVRRPSLKPKGRDTSVSTIDELESLIRNAKPNLIDDRIPPEPIVHPETPIDDKIGELDALAKEPKYKEPKYKEPKYKEPKYSDHYQRLFDGDGTLSTLKIDVKTDTIESNPSNGQAVSLIFTYPGKLPQQFNSSYSVFLSSLNLKVQGSRYEKGLLECVFIMHNDQIIAEWDQTDVYQTIAKKYDGDCKVRLQYTDEDNAEATISLPLCYSWETNGCCIPFINDGSFIMIVKWSEAAVNIKYSLHASMSICNTPRYQKILDCKRLLYLGSSVKLPFEFTTDCFVHDVFVKCDNKIEYLGLYKDGICLHGKNFETPTSVIATNEDYDNGNDDIFQLSCINGGKALNLKGCHLGFMSVDLQDDEEDMRYDVFALVETGVPIY